MKVFRIIMLLAAAIALSAAKGRADTFDIPLQKFTSESTIELRCVNGSFNMALPIPERWDVKKVTLSFGYVHSAVLLKKHSAIVIRVNGLAVAQKSYDTLTDSGHISLSIPPKTFKSGYNTLSFEATQHTVLECEKPCSPDMWTTVDLNGAMLSIEYSLNPVPLKLAQAAAYLFDPKISPEGAVHFIIENDSSGVVTLAGAAAAGVARRFDYKKVVFSASGAVRPGYDNILLGKKKFVDAFFKEHGLNPLNITGPFLKVMHMPSGQGGRAAVDDKHALLVVSGITDKDISIASKTLTSMTISYPGTDEMTPVEFSMPEITVYGGRQILTAEKRYELRNLGLDSRTFKGFNSSPAELTFRLSTDFFIKQNQYAELTLNFSYGAGMRPDSVFNIVLNGKTIRAIHLNNDSGDLIEGYKVNLPTYLFRPGPNTIAFQPFMTPVARECELLQPGNLFLTLYDKSTLYFPPMPHFMELPGIEHFFLNGFPFTRWPDGFESKIYLPRPDGPSIAAALNTIGLITQKNGFPVFSMQVDTKELKPWEGELMVISASSDVPDEMKKAAPLTLGSPSTVPYPIMRNWEGEDTIAYSKQISGPGPGLGMIMEFQSPYKSGRSVLLMTAETSGDVARLSEAILDPALQVYSKGDLVLVDLVSKPEPKISSFMVGKKYSTGKLGKVSMIENYLSSSTYLYLAAIAAAVVIISAAMYFLLKRARAKKDMSSGGGKQ